MRQVWVNVIVALCALSIGGYSASAQEEPQEPAAPLPADFFAAKAAAGGQLDTALSAQTRALAKDQLITQVQHAIEYWAADHDGDYPQHINQILLGAEPYAKPGFYANPYTAAAVDELNAVEMPFGWTPASPGNFSYVQMYDAAGRVIGYTLILYGASPGDGYDIDNDGISDGVILSLGSSSVPYVPGLISYLSGGRTMRIWQGE